MPSGDPQRVWFAELVEMLRQGWTPDLAWDAWIDLRDRLDGELQSLRARRGIQSPRMRCPRCGSYGPVAPPKVSVRAAILALERFRIADTEFVRDLDRRWAAYRRSAALNLYGKPATPRGDKSCHA